MSTADMNIRPDILGGGYTVVLIHRNSTKPYSKLKCFGKKGNFVSSERLR